MINNTSDLVKIVRLSILKILDAFSIDQTSVYVLLGGQNEPIEKKDHTILITPVLHSQPLTSRMIYEQSLNNKLSNKSETLIQQTLQIDVFGTSKTMNAHDLAIKLKAGFEHCTIKNDILNAGVIFSEVQNMVQRHEKLSQNTFEQISTFEIVLMYNIVVEFQDINKIEDVLCGESEVHFIWLIL